MLDFIGYLILILFTIFLISMINKGPYIFSKGTTYYINIKDKSFGINNLTINKGDTVIFVNYDQFRHSVVTNDSLIPNSEILYKYDTYSHTFNREGTYTFKSSLYDNMDSIDIHVREVVKGTGYYGKLVSNIATFIISSIINILSTIKYFVLSTIT